jgi:hypothetical protein
LDQYLFHIFGLVAVWYLFSQLPNKQTKHGVTITCPTAAAVLRLQPGNMLPGYLSVG